MCAYEVTVQEKSVRAGTAHKQSAKPSLWRRGRNVLARSREPENQNLIAVGLVALFLGFWVVQRYNLGLSGLVTRAQGYPGGYVSWMVDAERRDPKVGQRITLPPLFTLDGRKITLPHSEGLTALAFMGNCTACATRDEMESLRNLAQRFPKIKFYLVLMTGDVALAKALWQGSESGISLLVDRKAETAVRLNAIHRFRRYVFDGSGRLLMLTRRGESAQGFESALSRLNGSS